MNTAYINFDAWINSLLILPHVLDKSATIIRIHGSHWKPAGVTKFLRPNEPRNDAVLENIRNGIAIRTVLAAMLPVYHEVSQPMHLKASFPSITIHFGWLTF